jgi:hypothetical protein
MTVLVLVPTAILFGRDWQDVSSRHDSAALEQKGVEYLTALSPLLNSLVEGESSALQGVSAAPDSEKAAIARVADVDQRYGRALKTTARWNSIQDKAGKLPKVTGGATAVFQAHSEVLDLTVALYDTVRRNSELNRDTANDIANLQQAVATDLPVAVVRTNRMGDYANMTNNATGKLKATLGAQFAEEVAAVQDSVDTLTTDLQAAVEDTTSQTLSGTLVTTLDSFRRGVESMNRGANLGAEPNLATIAIAQSSLQTALTALAGTALKEMASILDDRTGSLNYRRTEAIVLGLIAIVLVLGAIVWRATGRGRDDTPAAPATPVGDTTSDLVAARTGGYGSDSFGQAPAYGEVNSSRRERSGAVR